MIFWRDKLRAVLLHLLITIGLCACVGAVIFFIWFPAPFLTMMDGTKLFALVLGCDLVLGPLMSLVIYNRSKSRRELIIDYAVVGTIQILALLYGANVVAESRPVYVVFLKDRLEVVSAAEIDASDLTAGSTPEYQSKPWWGPQLAAVEMPTDVKEKNQALFMGLAGRDLSARPKYYRSYESKRADIQHALQPFDVLFIKHPEAKSTLLQAISDTGHEQASLGWLPVKHRRGFWTVLVDRETAKPLKYLPIYPY